MTANPLTPTSVVAMQAPAASQGTRFTPLDPVRVLHQYMIPLILILLLSIAIGGILYVVCKTTMGYDWTYTLVQKLHVAHDADVFV